MKRLKQLQWIAILLLVVLGTFAYAQYGASSISPEEPIAQADTVYTFDGELKGEWVEIIEGIVYVSSAAPEKPRPEAYPYFYFSRNWDNCVEYTQEFPEGRVCSMVFTDILKKAELFQIKETTQQI